MMVPFWKAIVVIGVLEVSQPDAGEVNHLIRITGMGGKHIHVSYTGPKSLGDEGETIRVRLRDVECEEGFGVEEHPSNGPIGYRAWICNAEKAERLN